jgi:hypothetical protein
MKYVHRFGGSRGMVAVFSMLLITLVLGGLLWIGHLIMDWIGSKIIHENDYGDLL